MIFVINKLKYDTEKMELVSDKVRYCFYLMRCLTEARLYRSRKGRWLIVNENGTYAIAIDEKSAKNILLSYDVETYEKMFGELEEA